MNVSEKGEDMNEKRVTENNVCMRVKNKIKRKQQLIKKNKSTN